MPGYNPGGASSQSYGRNDSASGFSTDSSGYEESNFNNQGSQDAWASGENPANPGWDRRGRRITAPQTVGSPPVLSPQHQPQYGGIDETLQAPDRLASLTAAVANISAPKVDEALRQAIEADNYGGYTPTSQVGPHGPPGMPGTPDNYYDLQALQEAQLESEDFGSKFGSLFGVGSELEFNPNKGWEEGTQFSPESFATSPVGGGLTSLALGPLLGPLALPASKGIQYGVGKNKGGAEVMDYTRNYDFNPMQPFGQNPQYNPHGSEGLPPGTFGDGGPAGEQGPTQSAQVLNTPQNTEASVLPTPPEAVRPWDHLQQQWDGNNFLLAPLRRT